MQPLINGEPQSLRSRFGLTPRQEAFAIAIHGNPQNEDATRLFWETYRKGPLPPVDSQPYKDACSSASRLSRNVKVQSALEHLREESKSDAIAGHQERLEILTRIIRGEREGNAIQAINEANKMDGGHSARRSEVHVEGEVSLMSMILDAQTHDLRS